MTLSTLPMNFTDLMFVFALICSFTLVLGNPIFPYTTLTLLRVAGFRWPEEATICHD